MKKQLIRIIIGLMMVCLIVTPCLADESYALSDDYLTVKEYEMADTYEELMALAKKSTEVSDFRVEAIQDDQEIPCYVVIEKARDVIDKQTGERGTISRVTVFASDEKTRRDEGAYTTRVSIRAYFYGTLTKNSIDYHRISKWEGRYERLDNTVSYPIRATYSLAFGETYDGGQVGSSVWNPARAERSLSNSGQWYSLYPSWSSEYISHTGLTGQMGGTYVKINRGTSSWELEVKITDYGLEGFEY
ncbi:MAG: hypothetical protein GXY40_04065 [Syntrophomonadaceae bacterium]|nr:hypothetical protein [Syntrophomonadaceae bacterium]